MTATVIPIPAPVLLPIQGSSERFPVRRIFCVGRNYAAHRAEMGGDDRDPPFFFAKPADAAVPVGEDGSGGVPYPSATADLHHEVELVLALGAGGADLTPAQGQALIWGYAAGVDLTRRDLQAAAKAKGQPWDASKGFDASAPIGPIRPADQVDGLPQGAIRLTVNGQARQDAKVADMIWSVPEIVAEASKLWRLEPGDLIFTGTPEGVGALQRGDRVEGEVEGVGRLAFRVT